MIIITKKEHNDHIKPLIEKIENTLNKLNFSESLIANDYFINIIKSEYQYDKLLKILKEITSLKIQIAKKYNFNEDINNVLSFLQEKEQPST